MKCPFCNSTMVKGVALSARLSGIAWLPDGKLKAWPLLFFDGEHLLEMGGIVLSKPVYAFTFKNSFSELPAYVCRTCKKGVFDYSDC